MIATAGPVVSVEAVYVTVNVAVPTLFAASVAVTVNTFVPGWSSIPITDQLAVPVATPLPPRSLLHTTCVTPMLSDALPVNVKGSVLVVYVGAAVGVLIFMDGAVVSAGTKFTVIDTVVEF